MSYLIKTAQPSHRATDTKHINLDLNSLFLEKVSKCLSINKVREGGVEKIKRRIEKTDCD